MKKILKKKLLLEMEIQKRFIAYYHGMINRMAGKGIRLSSKKMIQLSTKQDKHFFRILKLKAQYGQVMRESIRYCEELQ